MFGFWMYILSDCFIFACLFATFVILRNNTFGSASGSEIFSLSFVLKETLILLTSSFTVGLAMLAGYRGKRGWTLVMLGVTLVLGIAFLALEINEFRILILEGHGPSASGFLSSYFTLVGTHGLHVTLGSVWMVLVMIWIAARSLTKTNVRRLVLLSLFWHFLDIIWIFIFTIVYLMAFL